MKKELTAREVLVLWEAFKNSVEGCLPIDEIFSTSDVFFEFIRNLVEYKFNARDGKQ